MLSSFFSIRYDKREYSRHVELQIYENPNEETREGILLYVK
jgi:hypothetical protein